MCDVVCDVVIDVVCGLHVCDGVSGGKGCGKLKLFTLRHMIYFIILDINVKC